MIAVGIDPGTRRLGWGVVRRDANRMRHVAHGVIVLDPKLELCERLLIIDRELERVLREFEPEVGSVETMFFYKDARAAAKLGHARGVVLLVLQRLGIEVAEYEPARIKQTVAGRGRADKRQVAEMVRGLLSLDHLPESDAADALAAALTHLRQLPIAAALERSRKSSRRSSARRPRRRPARGASAR